MCALFPAAVCCYRRASGSPRLYITINWPSGADRLWPVSSALQFHHFEPPKNLLLEQMYFWCFHLYNDVQFWIIQSLFNYFSLLSSFTAAYLNVGIILVSQGKIEEAKRTFHTCADIPDENLKDPHAHKSSVTSCLYNLGKLLHELGQHEVFI